MRQNQHSTNVLHAWLYVCAWIFGIGMLQALLLSFLLADKGDYAVLTVSVYVCDKLVKTLWTDMCEIFGVDGIRTRNYVFDCCFDTVEDRHFPEFSSSDICVNVLYIYDADRAIFRTLLLRYAL